MVRISWGLAVGLLEVLYELMEPLFPNLRSNVLLFLKSSDGSVSEALVFCLYIGL